MSAAADLALLRWADGLLVSVLDEAEQAALGRLIAAGAARREYSGAAGFLGMARVRLVESETTGERL